MLFPGVICPNSLLSLRIATYGASLSSPLSVADPKYSFPLDFATTSKPGEADGTVVGTVEVVGVLGVVVAGALDCRHKIGIVLKDYFSFKFITHCSL